MFSFFFGEKGCTHIHWLKFMEFESWSISLSVTYPLFLLFFSLRTPLVFVLRVERVKTYTLGSELIATSAAFVFWVEF